MSPVAVVTGSNKGIGFAIVRGLCKRFTGDVYLTARSEERGKKAVEELRKEGLKPLFHQLDVTDDKSIEKLRDFIKEKYGGLDVLVNNAAIAFKADATEPIHVQAQETTFVNYFSLVNTCNILFPILNKGARVVNISSSAGHLSRIPSADLRKKLNSDSLTVEELSTMVKQFVEATKTNSHEADWGKSTYVVSKVAVSALTKIQQRELASKDIKVNSVHPGYVDTDMTSHKGILTIDRGAEAPLWLALDAPDDLRGAYVWHDKRVIDWDSNVLPAQY